MGAVYKTRVTREQNKISALPFPPLLLVSAARARHSANSRVRVLEQTGPVTRVGRGLALHTAFCGITQEDRLCVILSGAWHRNKYKKKKRKATVKRNVIFSAFY